jgi:hypothetical protein
LWGVVDLLESFAIRSSEFVEIFDDFVTADGEVVVVGSQGFVTTALDVQRDQVKTERIATSEKEPRELENE